MAGRHNERTQIFERSTKLTDRFEVIKILGQGTAGVVYRAKDRHRNKEVALKVLSSDHAFDEHTITRFHEELEACQKVVHPNLVQAFDLIKLEDSLAFTMELIDGCDLGQLIGQGKMSFDEVDKVMCQLLDAVQVLHQNNIVHRDIKLENVMLRSDGVVKLSDLGLLKKVGEKGLTAPGILLGTPQYMPPEYVKDGKYDARSDIYACGIILYELLSGQRHLADRPGGAALEHLLRTDFAFPQISIPATHEKYINILTKSLAKSPDKRFNSAKEMRDAFNGQVVGDESDLRLSKSLVFGGTSKREKANQVNIVLLMVLTFVMSLLAAIGVMAWLRS